MLPSLKSISVFLIVIIKWTMRNLYSCSFIWFLMKNIFHNKNSWRTNQKTKQITNKTNTHAHTDRKQQQNKTKSKNAMWYLESFVAMKLSWKYILFTAKYYIHSVHMCTKMTATAFTGVQVWMCVRAYLCIMLENHTHWGANKDIIIENKNVHI